MFNACHTGVRDAPIYSALFCAEKPDFLSKANAVPERHSFNERDAYCIGIDFALYEKLKICCVSNTVV
jgi:hypothetical protein